MSIYVNEDQSLFHLQSKQMSYVIQIVDGLPLHAYWGKKLRADRNLQGLMVGVPAGAGLDRLPQEYPQYGSGDFRNPAYQVQLDDGTRITELRYEKHRLVAGKPALEGLPAVYVESDDEAHTLELELCDAYSGLTVVLLYTVFEDMDAVVRSVRFFNNGNQSLQLKRALCASVDM